MYSRDSSVFCFFFPSIPFHFQEEVATILNCLGKGTFLLTCYNFKESRCKIRQKNCSSQTLMALPNSST